MPAKRKSVSYAKWGYFFIAPFFLTFAVFSLYPLFSTFFNSFFESYYVGLERVGPNFIGLANYKEIFAGNQLPQYFINTGIMFFMGFIPQLVFSLLLASWFSDARLNLKAKTFFKTIIYMPNLIMAAAFSMLFFALFSDSGPINSILVSYGFIAEPFRFLSHTGTTRGLIALMNYMMWFGNTTILLLAAMLGVDPSMIEAAEIDGASPGDIFRKITLPIINPVLVYVMITSLVGGLQMFDVPQILTNGNGNPNRTSMTIIMYLNKHLYSKNYGLGGAVSVILFIVLAVLSVIVFKTLAREDGQKSAKPKRGKGARV